MIKVIDLEILLTNLKQSIKFHQTNKDDPHNVGMAVMVALIEVESAILKSIVDKVKPNVPK